MTRTEIIQHLIDAYGLRSYVEIGVQKTANNFDKIRCDWKCSVDPDSNSDAFVKMTSDQYFSYQRLDPPKIDIFFIDGFHEKEQVLRDVNNALRELSDNGFIVVHDCNPPSELVQRMPRPDRQLTKSWTGDVWKAIVDLRERKDIITYTVDTDWGCAVIHRGKNDPFNFGFPLTYEALEKNRHDLLGLITVQDFLFIHKNDYGQVY